MKRKTPINIRKELESFRAFVHRLSAVEQELYKLAIDKRLRQRDIAEIIGITQGGVSSRLSKMLKRVQFMRVLDSFDLEKMDNDLKNILDPLEIEVLRMLARTTCQEEAARKLNILFGLQGDKSFNQVKIRYRFVRAWEKLAVGKTATCRKYTSLFGFIQDNLYMLHEVKLPQFERGHVCTQKL